MSRNSVWVFVWQMHPSIKPFHGPEVCVNASKKKADAERHRFAMSRYGRCGPVVRLQLPALAGEKEG